MVEARHLRFFVVVAFLLPPCYIPPPNDYNLRVHTVAAKYELLQAHSLLPVCGVLGTVMMDCIEGYTLSEKGC